MPIISILLFFGGVPGRPTSINLCGCLKRTPAEQAAMNRRPPSYQTSTTGDNTAPAVPSDKNIFDDHFGSKPNRNKMRKSQSRHSIQGYDSGDEKAAVQVSSYISTHSTDISDYENNSPRA